MSLNNFLSFLQQILTMVDPQDPNSIKRAYDALVAVFNLAQFSNKIDSLTYRVMREAIEEFENLVQNASSFAGKPGQYVENEQKRRRLQNALRPGC